MRRVVIVASVVALLVVACGGEPETETFASPTETSASATETSASTAEDGLVEAITDSNSETLDSRFGEGSTACISRGIVDQLGIDGLAQVGVTEETPDLQGGRVFAAPETARQVVDVTIDCIDLAAELVSSLPEGMSLLDDSVDCVVDQLESETFRDLFADLVTSGGEPADIVTQAAAQLPMASLLLTCLSPEEFLRVGDLIDGL